MKKKLVQLTAAHMAWLTKEAKRRDRPVNYIIRELVSDAMKEKPLT